jgi:inner membrane protein YidH
MEHEPNDPRVRFAAERTLLAWIRTGLAMMGFGFVVAKFGFFLRELAAIEVMPERHTGWSLYLGAALVVMGVVVNIAAAIAHLRIVGRLERGEAIVEGRWSLGIFVALAVASVGSAMAIYLFWFGR